jgi:hypothetical protein
MEKTGAPVCCMLFLWYVEIFPGFLPMAEKLAFAIKM